MNGRTLLLATVLLVTPLSAEAQLAPRMWMAPNGDQLPFEADEQILEFLREAEIMAAEEIPAGTTRPQLVTLRRNGLEARAVFRWVEERARRVDDASQHGEITFRDSASFETAAYELARLVNIDHVPPTVQRTYDRRDGTLQLWIEGAMTERNRLDQGAEDPVQPRWQRQLGVMNVFDALVGNLDRNRGNMLIDQYWRVWFIDHTRAFRGSTRMDSDNLNAIEKALWDGLQALDHDVVRNRIAPFLTERELTALLSRADLLVEHFQALIRKHGEDRVVYTY
ncbi:MAG: hypothetical protein GKS06_12050 [Acidobacteria bacterium]|nr:hypothetical protein [Acidobacteriota bacterium]